MENKVKNLTFSTILKEVEKGNLKASEAEKLITKESVIMPKKITAENGSKALMMGEFFETIEIPNLEYYMEDELYIEEEEIEEYEIIQVAISWTTIKNIYDKLVKYHA